MYLPYADPQTHQEDVYVEVTENILPLDGAGEVKLDHMNSDNKTSNDEHNLPFIIVPKEILNLQQFNAENVDLKWTNSFYLYHYASNLWL